MARQRRSAPARTQTRSASTAAHYPSSHPTTASRPTSQTQQGPGLFGQMASTAAGVAVGSTIGHTIGHGITSMFGGSSAPAEPVQQQQTYQQQPQTCDVDAKNFTRCLSENDGNMQICDYYLQQLKACQDASRHY